MSIEFAAIPAGIKEGSREFRLRKRIIGLIAGVVISILVSALVWVLAVAMPSKTGSPFAPVRDVCKWIYDTSIGTGIRESTLLFPIIEGVHLLGIALSVGMLCWLDLRLLGLVMTDEPVSRVWKRVMPPALAGFVLMFITGGLLFWAEAATAYNSVHFWIKMSLLVLAAVNAGVFELTTHKHVAEWDTAAVLPMRARMAGLISLLLWTAIIVTGRTMAYSF
jgi:hypothetical protein